MSISNMDQIWLSVFLLKQSKIHKCLDDKTEMDILVEIKILKLVATGYILTSAQLKSCLSQITEWVKYLQTKNNKDGLHWVISHFANLI